MATVEVQRILATRLLDHFQTDARWVETSNDPLDASVVTAPLDKVTEEILQRCAQDWDTIQKEIQEQLNSDVTLLNSDLTRAEAATADYFIHQVKSEFLLIIEETQEDPVTAEVPFEFEPDPLVHEFKNAEYDASYL